MPKEVKLCDLNLAEHIRPGDTITWGQASAEPLDLTEKLVAQQEDIGHCNVFVGLSLSETLAPGKHQHISVTSYGAIGTNVKLAATGNLAILPGNYSSISQNMVNKRLPIDVVLVQVSPKGADGHYSLGLANDYLIPAMQAARVVIAEVNENVPNTTLAEPLDETLIDIVVPSSRTPLYAPESKVGDDEKAIADHLCPYIDDGAVIQYGIGSVPSAILAALSGHKRIGIHSGMITDDIIPLIESGVITNETNALRPGISIGAMALGSKKLSNFLHNNPAVELHPSTTTHNASMLGQQTRLVALNSALEVDLYGQVNAEMAGERYLGAVGGQIDFMHAASTHQRGISVIALPSVTRNGKRSRIVKQLTAPMVTTAKSDVDIIVTEQGVADLRGKTLQQRREAISKIAAPQFRDTLK